MTVTTAEELIAAELAAATAPCVTASFQADCVVLVHLLQKHRPGIPVLFLDTAHHFEETLRYRDRMAAAWNLNLVILRAADPAPGLWRESTHACCDRHKVGPLFSALRGYDTWFTGLRREQSPSRAGLQEIEPFSIGEAATLRKISPLARWTAADVREYASAQAIPLLPLYEQGYTSIGCAPCTSLPREPGNERSGRWGGEKLECGIHIQPRP